MRGRMSCPRSLKKSGRGESSWGPSGGKCELRGGTVEGTKAGDEDGVDAGEGADAVCLAALRRDRLIARVSHALRCRRYLIFTPASLLLPSLLSHTH